MCFTEKKFAKSCFSKLRLLTPSSFNVCTSTHMHMQLFLMMFIYRAQNGGAAARVKYICSVFFLSSVQLRLGRRD